ncbi:MAG TPA: sigma-70 family RNA polymerase sigma factor [Acidimicrobiales bacterium]|nr:sigma-70 family RNA polymerase sigma factor [Acidimicrobiales bacterium]
MKPDLRNASDVTLAMAIARWDQEALAEVYRRNAGPVFGLARRVLGDAAVAEEVVQEVFLRLWHEPGRYDPERGSLRTFLLSQVHSRAVDMLRSDTARRQREIRDARSTASGQYDVEHEFLDIAVAEGVRDALGVLQPGERSAIELAYFGGHTYREVAVILGEPEGTIKSRIRSGMRRMHSSLAAKGLAVGNMQPAEENP